MRGDFIARVFAQADKIVQSRSSALVPLQWTSLILVGFLLFFVVAKAPAWIDIGIFVLLALVQLLALAAYLYFMLRNPDALRSEKHALSKYAIDKGLYGDSDSGMQELFRPGDELPLLGARQRKVLSVTSTASREEPH